VGFLNRLFARQPPAASIDLRGEIERIDTLVKEAKGRGDYALEVAQDMSLPTKMLAFMSWLELRPPQAGPAISIVLATRNRPQLLARALPSVRAQRYERWQLVVVDDGEDPGTRRVVESIGDERVLLVARPRSGLGAARNAGLARASRGWWPSFWQLPWSREKLLEENVTDAGSLAHRRELDEARFDEELSTGEDWELLLRLTADREALAVPAISHAYALEGADRMSLDPAHRAGREAIRRRHAGA